MEVTARQRHPRLPLALWICAPMIGAAAVFLAVLILPTAECGPFLLNSNAGRKELFPGFSQEVLLAMITGLASISVGAFGLMRLSDSLRRWSRPVVSALGAPILIGLFLLVGIGAVALAGAIPARLLIGIFLVGSVLTGLALVLLLVRCAQGASVERVRAPLGLYLLGAGLAVYPAITGIALYRFNTTC